MVADRLSITRTEVCAIGDNLNDQDMVSWAGFGVAMGNAPEALKAAAKYVTGPIGEAGVAQVIERFVIRNNEPPLRG
jgi:hydroxymethylpyrimidine pyrophosphatase-like HAD family hydrolase